METVQLQAHYEDRYRSIRHDFEPLSGSSTLPFPSRSVMAWRAGDNSYTTPPPTASGQVPLRYTYPHDFPSHSYNTSTEPSPTFRPPVQTYETDPAAQTLRENSPGRMSARDGQGQARPRDRIPSDEGYASHEVVDWEYPTRDNTPELSNTDQLINVANSAYRRHSQDSLERSVPEVHRYSPYHVPSHPRHDSTSDHRSASPAPSMASNGTSSASRSSVVQSTAVESIVPTSSRRHRKRRLYTVDRRSICVMAKENPHLRQEDIAQHFNVERSTVSKILKEKVRWLSTPAEPTIRVSKYRLAKFPRLEADMKAWVVSESAAGLIFTDAMIRNKAKELNVKWKYETEGKFRASPGWIENFKTRVGIRKGRYIGNGTSEQKANAQGVPVDWNRWQQPHEPQVADTGSSLSNQSNTNQASPTPVLPQEMEPQPQPVVWQQEQQSADTWSQQQTTYAVPEPVVSTYDTMAIANPAVGPPPAYGQEQAVVQTLPVEFAAAGSGGNGGDGMQPEEYHPDEGCAQPEQTADPRLNTLNAVSVILHNTDFQRKFDLSADDNDTFMNILRMMRVWIGGTDYVRM